MPLAFVNELIDFAENEEEKHQKIEMQKTIFPYWILIQGQNAKQENEEDMDFFKWFDSLYDKHPKAEKIGKTKSSKEIMDEFMPIINSNRNQGEGGK